MDAKIKALDGVIPGVFSNREEAEAALAELRELGFADDELGVVVPDPVHHRFLDDSLREALKGVGYGVVIGGALGAIAGVAVVMLAVPGLGPIGIGGALLFGLRDGSAWGGIIGGHLGLSLKFYDLADTEHEYEEIALKPEEILVVVMADRERGDAVCALMQRHGARCAREATPSETAS